MVSSSRVGKCLQALLLALVAAGAGPAEAIDFNAFWLYRASGGEGVESRRTLEQRYTLGAGPGVTYSPTHAISLGGNLSYQRTERVLDDGRTVTTEDITPSAAVGVANDIFRAGLFGTATQRRVANGPDLDSRAWQATLASGWDRRFWPSLQLHYSERYEESDDGATDIEDKGYGLSADWDAEVAQLFYRYNNRRLEDLARGSRSDEESHFVRVETGGRFWGDRVNVTLSQQFDRTFLDFSADIPEEGAFERVFEGAVTLFAKLGPADAPREDPESVVPAALGGLGDGDRSVVPEAAFLDLDWRGHLGVRFSALEQVDRLYVYLSESQVAPEDAATLQWDLYVPDAGPDPWVRVSENIPAVYNGAQNRIELQISRREREVMVVVTNATGEVLRFTELEAVQLLTEDQSEVRTTHLTNATMRVRLTDTVSASSSVALERSDSDLVGDSYRRSLSGNLRWVPIPAVAPSVGFSETREGRSGEPEAINRSYSLIVATFPLPTLQVTLGATRTDRFTGSRREATTDRYSVTSTARLYPDLTAGLDLAYATTDRAATEASEASATGTYSSRFTLNARIRPTLTADLTANYRRSESDAAGSSNLDSTLSLAYRPSDLLSIRATGTRNWTNEDIPDTLTVTTNLALLRAEKTRVNFRHSFSRSQETRNRYGMDASWDISRNLTLETRGDYTAADADRWNAQASLSLRL